MALIWLFLLGLSSIANGHYTPIEVVLTLFMAAFSAAGVSASIRLGQALRLAGRVVAIVVFGALQVGTIWVSFLKPIANR